MGFSITKFIICSLFSLSFFLMALNLFGFFEFATSSLSLLPTIAIQGFWVIFSVGH